MFLQPCFSNSLLRFGVLFGVGSSQGPRLLFFSAAASRLDLRLKSITKTNRARMLGTRKREQRDRNASRIEVRKLTEILPTLTRTNRSSRARTYPFRKDSGP